MDSRRKAVWAVVAVVVAVAAVAGFFGIRNENRKADDQRQLLTEMCVTSARQQSYSTSPMTRNVETSSDLIVTGEVSEGAFWYSFSCDGIAVAELAR